jgi:hypothetical protein
MTGLPRGTTKEQAALIVYVFVGPGVQFDTIICEDCFPLYGTRGLLSGKSLRQNPVVAMCGTLIDWL